MTGLLGELNWHWSFAIYGLAAPFAFLAALTLPDKPPATQDRVATPSPSLIRWFPFRFALLGLVLGTIIYIQRCISPFS